MGVQPFYGKGPHPLQWACSRHAREKIISGMPNRLNYCVIFVVYTRLLLKRCIWSIALFVAWTWSLRKVDQIYLGSFEMWCLRRMEKSVGLIVWEMRKYYRVKEERNNLRTIKGRMANWIGHILRRNCFLWHLIEGKRDISDGKTMNKE